MELASLVLIVCVSSPFWKPVYFPYKANHSELLTQTRLSLQIHLKKVSAVLPLCCNFSHPRTLCSPDPVKNAIVIQLCFSLPNWICGLLDGKERLIIRRWANAGCKREQGQAQGGAGGGGGGGGYTLNANARLEKGQTGPFKCRAHVFS